MARNARNYLPTENLNLTIEDDGLFIEARVQVTYDAGSPAWKGSIYTCPSDADWYGEDPSVGGIEEIEATNVVYIDEDGEEYGLGADEPAYVERAVERFVADWVHDHRDEVDEILNERLRDAAEASAEAWAEDRAYDRRYGW
jgi:hypothetical protein